MVLYKLLTLLSIVTWASAGPMVVHESRSAPPPGFVRQGVAPDNTMLTLRLALASNDVAGLEEKLMSLATPGSSEFRQWLSMDEVKSFVQPSPETVAVFDAFASANGLSPKQISPNGDWVSLTLPVSQANQLFATQFALFTPPDKTRPITRTLSVSLPAELVGHVEVIHPTTQFLGPGSRLQSASSESGDDKRPQTPASCDSSAPTGVITPACLQDLYGIPTSPATQKSNALLVTAYVEQYAQTADLAAFLKLLRPDMPSTTTFKVISLDNGTDPQGPDDAGVEADLDIEYTVGIATGVPVEFLSVGGGDTDEDFASSLLDTTTFLDGVPNPPSAMTTSYGLNEEEFGSSLATKICNGYMALGARGISVLTASGDGGVRGNHDDLTVCNVTDFIPVFPASCPFVTAVGSTQGFAPEKAINFTGGGFSNFFPAKPFQRAAISGFLKTIPPHFAGTFNKSGRGYPDVALQGWNFEVVAGGETGLVGGTSASSPTFAGIIALINDRLISERKSTLGFLNPFLYSRASNAFTDITIGHNSGFECPASSVAFDAAPGWDPLTGFGSPIFSKLLAAAKE
ncbi:family S53 protease-like protein [Mycena albidolilacea]|uniref:Family S53 protease-like protein n=1 Tax=Mycena albidolilacea TaxID=1033008 RepID=A0AAD7ER31_9AGAR|nr:family S53 protease-like protein [Mycena albidolilacea]